MSTLIETSPPDVQGDFFSTLDSTPKEPQRIPIRRKGGETFARSRTNSVIAALVKSLESSQSIAEVVEILEQRSEELLPPNSWPWLPRFDALQKGPKPHIAMEGCATLLPVVRRGVLGYNGDRHVRLDLPQGRQQAQDDETQSAQEDLAQRIRPATAESRTTLSQFLAPSQFWGFLHRALTGMTVQDEHSYYDFNFDCIEDYSPFLSWRSWDML